MVYQVVIKMLKKLLHDLEMSLHTLTPHPIRAPSFTFWHTPDGVNVVVAGGQRGRSDWSVATQQAVCSDTCRSRPAIIISYNNSKTTRW